MSLKLVQNRLNGAANNTLPLLENYEWQEEAACRDADPDLFYYRDMERGEHRRKRELAAKKICKSCPVLNTCAAFALDNVEVYGIWGGLTEKDRQRVLGRKFRR